MTVEEKATLRAVEVSSEATDGLVHEHWARAFM